MIPRSYQKLAQICWAKLQTAGVIVIAQVALTHANEDTPTEAFRIYRSPEISQSEWIVEVNSLDTGSNLQVKLLSEKLDQSKTRLSRLLRLFNGGGTSQVEVDRARIEVDHFANQLQAQSQYRDLVQGLKEMVTDTSFVESPRQNGEGDIPEYQVRLPGLSLRSGELDLFTVSLAARPETAQSSQDYTQSRLEESLAFPHKDLFVDYFRDRLDKLSILPTARPTELERTQQHLDMVLNRQDLANHKFSKRFRQAGRAEKLEGAADSFWLFGDGAAVATPDTAISETTVAVAEQQALARHREVFAANAREMAQMRHDQLASLQSRGFSNAAELREARLALDLANLSVKKARAEQEVAKRELDQIRAAGINLPETIVLPEMNGVGDGAAERWLIWLTEQPTMSASEVLRFLKLVESRFLLAANTRIAQREYASEKNRLDRIRRIASVREIELQMQQSRLNQAIALFARATDEETLAILKLRQWAQRIQHPPTTTAAAASPEALEAVIKAGKAVNEAKLSVANLELEQMRTQHQYDSDYHQRILDLQRRGAATSYEVERARNQMQSSKGQSFTALKELARVKQEAIFVKTLFESGSMTYDEKGLHITRFMPEAIAELEKLTILKDGVDDGKVMTCEAELADAKSRIAELNRLINFGTASPVELERVTIQRQMIENQLSIEKSKASTLVHAIKLVKSLEYQPETQKTLPTIQNPL